MKRVLLLLVLLGLTLGTYSSNSGIRHQTAVQLSEAACAYYTGEYQVEALSLLEASASEIPAAVWASPLCAALHTLMTETRTHLPSYSETLSLFTRTDASGGSSEPLLFYSDTLGAFQREQVWADARGNFYRDGAGSDLHHLRPVNAQIKAARSCMTFGNVRTESQSYQTVSLNGTPVLWIDASWNYGAGLVEVRDEVKGDVARILLYVWAVYGSAEGENQNLWVDLPPSGLGLDLNEGQRVIASKEVLLDWCRLDPVDTWEMGRNDAVQSIQDNRNVFIDYPEFCWLLLGEEIPDMPTPSGWAHSLFCTVTAAAEPQAGGTVTVSGRTVTATPNPGYKLTGWTLTPADAAEVVQTENQFHLRNLRADCLLTVMFAPCDPCADGHSWDAGTVTLVPSQSAPGVVTYTCTRCGTTRTEEVPFRFDDVLDAAAYYFAPVYWALEAAPQITAGTDANHFSPHQSCTRAQAVSFLWRAAGSPEPRGTSCPFYDVPEQAYYRRAVLWAVENGYVSGTSSSAFSPNRVCTRAQMLTCLWRVAGSPNPAANGTVPFADVPTGAYYSRAVRWAAEQGITSGTAPSTFSPNAPCTRAQALTFLFRCP